jgi:hypothetical protein
MRTLILVLVVLFASSLAVTVGDSRDRKDKMKNEEEEIVEILEILEDYELLQEMEALESEEPVTGTDRKRYRPNPGEDKESEE